jgi:hypothetical protein
MAKCFKCQREMIDVSSSTHEMGVTFYLDHKKKVNLAVCREADCEMRGLVKVLSECPVHLDGHHFVACDEWSPTCVCGSTQKI